MKTFLIFLAIGLVTGEKLGLGYLPPPGAYLSGGSPGDIQGPLEPPRTTGTFNSRPLLDGQYPNNFVIQGNPQPGTVDSFVTEKVPSTTTTYAFSQTTTYPESYETTVLPIDPVTGLPIKKLNQNYAQPGYVQNNKQNGPYGDNIAQDQYGNKIITIGTKPIIGSNVNQPLNQNGNFPSLRNPNGQYQYGDKIPQNIQPGSQQGFSTSAPTTAATIPVNLYNTNEGYPGTNPQGTYSGAPIQVQENPQFIQPSYQGNVYEDGKSPFNVNTARPFIGNNENVYKPGVSVSNGLPSSTAASIPSSSYSPIYSTIRPFNRPERPQADADRNAVILNYENIRTPNGYSYSYDTSNGIHADETGVVDNGTKAQGKYSYIGDDGKIYSVSYTADENGFRPYGDHLPTPPPVPEAIQKVIEQAARDKAAGIVDDGSYDEAKYGGNTYRTPTNRRRPQYKNKVQQNQLENDRNTAGGRPIFSTTEPIVGTIIDQENSNERDNNNIYTTKQPFGANVISNAPGIVIEETSSQQLNPKAPFNLNEIVGTTIGPNNAVNYPSYDNQNIIVDKTRPGAFNIVSNNLQNLGKPVDINNNKYSSTQAPEYNQYTKQYNGLPKIEQSYSPKPNNVNGGQSQLQQQTFGDNPINQKDETGYYYQTPNTKFTEFRPQQNFNEQIIGPVTTVDNRGTPIRRPFITPDAKFSYKNTNQDGNANNGEATPSNIERISSTMSPQVLITSKGTNIPYGQKLNKVTVSPESKDNLGSTIFESTSPLPEGSRLQNTGVRKPEQNEQPQFTTVTTRRPILEYDSQTPKYSTGYPSETYRVSGSPGYNPSFTTPGYTYTDKVSQTPGYTTTAVPSTTRYYQPFQDNSPSSINDQRYYLPGSYYPTQSSTVGPTSNSIVNGIPTSTAAPIFGPNYQFGKSKGPIRGSNYQITSQVPTSTATPVLGPGYQYEPGKYIYNEYTYPGSTTTISQPTTPGLTENRPYGPGQSSKVASPLFNNGVGSPNTIGMEYGNGPVQQVFSSTTPSYVGTSSVSPVKTINQGYYQPSSTFTLVDEFGRPIISGFPNGNIPTNGSGNRFGTTVSPVSTNLVDEFGRPVDEFGRPVTSIQSNGNIPANRTPTVPSSNTNVVDGLGRPITPGSIINGNIPTNISVNRFGTVTPSSIANVVDDFGRPITSIQSNENLPNVPVNNIGTVTIGNNELGLNRNPVGMNQYYGQKIIGEDFSGPKQPQRFDPETGYHY